MQTFSWAVIGAGPAGIASIGKLIDNGVNPKHILWLDPKFNVGDLGDKWACVSSNTKVQLFLQFLNKCDAFNYQKRSQNYTLDSLDPTTTCELAHIVEPLQWITNNFSKHVNIKKMTVRHLTLHDRKWKIAGDHETMLAEQVILAIGAQPKVLNYDNVTTIPLEIALDKTLLANTVNTDDSVAVFGSSHSAIYVLKFLTELGVKKIVNFYRHPLKFAMYLEDFILFDNTGLKGITAKWAKENLHGRQPKNIFRYLSTAEHINQHLPDCDKAVYAIGFHPRTLAVNGLEQLDYNDKTGIIAPGLFGVGIAFPEGKYDPIGNYEYYVGLWKFMNYIDRVMPIWLDYKA